MDTATAQAIGVAAGALIIALLGYLTAWVQAHNRALASQQSQLDTRTGQPPPRSPRATDAAGGAAAVRQAPRWNQLQDPLPDGSLPAQRMNECGEECVAMEVSRQHGVPLSADALRSLLGGPQRSALTTAQDLVRCLQLCNVAAHAEAVDPVKAAARLQEITAADGVAIALGAWVSPSVLHWILVTRSDGQGASANDPWEGRRRSWTWAAFRGLYAGELVVSLRPPDGAA